MSLLVLSPHHHLHHSRKNGLTSSASAQISDWHSHENFAICKTYSRRRLIGIISMELHRFWCKWQKPNLCLLSPRPFCRNRQFCPPLHMQTENHQRVKTVVLNLSAKTCIQNWNKSKMSDVILKIGRVMRPGRWGWRGRRRGRRV